MRKRTGLHNKGKRGKSPYSVLNKSKGADRYGSYQNGKNVVGEHIDGRPVGSCV